MTFNSTYFEMTCFLLCVCVCVFQSDNTSTKSITELCWDAVCYEQSQSLKHEVSYQGETVQCYLTINDNDVGRDSQGSHPFFTDNFQNFSMTFQGPYNPKAKTPQVGPNY